MTRLLLLPALALALLAGLSVSAGAANGNGNHDPYHYILGEPPVEGPDTAVAPNGSTLTLHGSGDFKAGPNKSAGGGGSYEIHDASGGLIASGSWSATGILGFVSYGNTDGLPPELFGGQAKLRVSLEGVGSGVLTITCLLGSPPPGKDEGINLILGNGLNFTRATGGETVFILTS